LFDNGELPTRLTVPAQNFTSAFPKMGYLATRRILGSNKVNYSKRNIIQASDLKAKLDSLHIQQENVTIISLDIEAMYPSGYQGRSRSRSATKSRAVFF
jgi:hypothetical protein